jgi:enoyl-CoA hydratase/carnithine racemase
LYEKAGHVVTITMNRPDKKNAINGQMREELRQCWAKYRDDDDAWVAILTGAGEAFCSGGDLRDNLARSEGRLPEHSTKGRAVKAPTVYSDFVWEDQVYKPIIAAVNGFAGGGGFAMALNCDIRIASTNAQFGCSAVRWSHMAGGQAYLLPRSVPLGWAFWFLYTGQTIDAEKAFKIGLVQDVTPPDRLLPTALQLAEVICANGPLVSQYHKEYVYKALEMPLGAGRFLERVMYEQLRSRPDYDEGTRAFVQKRKANFSGH